MQLPPTLTSNQITTTAEDHTLGKTLFTRLAHLGVTPVMLRTQYRVSLSLTPVKCSSFNTPAAAPATEQDLQQTLLPQSAARRCHE